jgi:hypothetical protein
MKWILLLVTIAACGGAEARPVEDLMKPETCMACHPGHYQEWSGSMHAYSSDDPVFLALNKKGQADTNGELGAFCVQCHAPLALQLGLTTDGTNLADVPQWAKGIGCYSCHNVVEITGTHNNPLRLAMDQTMRAGISDAVESSAHFTASSPLIDAESQDSSAMCGSCHDIVTPAGIHLERTFAEWQTTIFAQEDPRKHVSCASCHMIVSTDVIAEGPGLDVPLRPFGRREHTFAGIDVALTPWAEPQMQRDAIARDLKGALLPRLCVLPTDAGRVDYRLDNVGTGHMFPTGATADRRAWAEIVAYDDNDQIVYSSGVVPMDEPYTDPEQLNDPSLWILGTPARDENGESTELFWKVATLEHPGTLLPPAVTTDPQNPAFYHSVEKSFSVAGLLPQIHRVTARVLIRPVPFSLLDELMSEGHLTTDVRPNVPTHTVEGTVLEWTAGGDACVCPNGPPCP